MPIILKDVKTSPIGDAIVVNGIDPYDRASGEMIRSKVVTSFPNGERLETIPKCGCPDNIALKGYNNLGLTCNHCGLVVAILDLYASSVWMRKPNHIDKLISIRTLFLIVTYFNIGKRFDIIRYIYDRQYNPSARQDAIINRLINAGVDQRGWNYFINNLTFILIELFKIPKWATKPNSKGRWLELYLIKHGVLPNPITGEMAECDLYPEWVPFPSSAIAFMEESSLGTYARVDQISETVIALGSVIGIDLVEDRERQEELIAAMYTARVKHHGVYINNQINGKAKVMRSSVMGSRFPNSGRAVVSAIQGPHVHDEVHLPWILACVIFEPQLHSKLGSLGYNPNDVRHMIHTTLHQPFVFNAEYETRKAILKQAIDDIIKTCRPRGEWIVPIPELQNGSRPGATDESIIGIPTIQGRNPSLTRSSLNTLRFTKVNDDPHDICINIPLALCPLFNADFDGDNFFFWAVNTYDAAEDARALRPHSNITALVDKPGSLTFIDTPKTAAVQIALFMKKGMDQKAEPPEGLFL